MKNDLAIDVYMHGTFYGMHYEIINNKSRNILTIRETNTEIDITDEIHEFVEKLSKKIDKLKGGEKWILK